MNGDDKGENGDYDGALSRKTSNRSARRYVVLTR